MRLQHCGAFGVIMNSNIKSLQDVFVVHAPTALCDMATEEKTKYIDSVMGRPVGSNGIVVNFLLSSAARRTNNRIYTPRGQRAGLSSWTEPFSKPILNQHRRDGEPLGRIISVDYVDKSQEAMKFFKTIQDFTRFRDIVEGEDSKAIYKALHKHNLLTNKAWPGLGALVAKARITDRDAIEKFLDQRYLTFSAGAHSDHYICGPCGADWATGDICEHSPGQITDDGEPVVFVTGIFSGDEASVVNAPGNDISKVLSIEFGDSIDTTRINLDGVTIDPTTIYHCDSTVEDEWILPARDFARSINTESVNKFKDAINGSTVLELNWIIRVHDALHSEWDWELRYRNDSETRRVPLDVFTLHGVIHQMSTDQNFRGSLINGELDSFDQAGNPSEQYKINSEDSMTNEELLKIFNDQLAAFKRELADSLKDSQPILIEEPDEPVNDESIDWYSLDIALSAELGDAKLSAEKREALNEKAFCGPERSFPVPDCTHVSAARRLIEKAKLSADQKAKVLACVDRKAKKMACDATSDSSAVKDCKCDEVSKDYAEALLQIDQLKAEIELLKNSATVLDTENTNSNNEPVQDSLPPVVDNPSIAGNGSGIIGANKQLGDYERAIVAKFKTIRDSKGDVAARTFLSQQKKARYLPATFDINQYIQEND